MNTLHHCHWQSRNHFKQQLCLIGKQDSLVIYGQVNSKDEQWLIDLFSHLGHAWYLVKHQTNPIYEYEINHHQWLSLITTHKNTLAWK